jgi:hypothetical protein
VNNCNVGISILILILISPPNLCNIVFSLLVGVPVIPYLGLGCLCAALGVRLFICVVVYVLH